MVENHTSAGSQDLREAIKNRWTSVALIDDTGAEETRIDIPNDSRASWGDPSTNPLTLTISVSGGDSDISLPVTLERTELYPNQSATDAYSGDNFDEGVATLGGVGDVLDVTHDVEQPEIN